MERERLLWRIMNIQPKPFEGPSALDLLAEFRKKFVALAENRSRELRDAIYARRDEGPSVELREIIDEYESLRHFEKQLNRVIRAFMDEATKPWQEAYATAMMQNFTPFVVAAKNADRS